MKLSVVLLFIIFAASLTFGQQSVMLDKSGKDAIIELRRYITSESENENWYVGSWGRMMAFQVYQRYNSADATQIALVEMVKPEPDLQTFGLLTLHDAELPQMTENFRRNLQSDDYLHHIQIIERYGTKDLLPDMINFYQKHKSTRDCSVTALALGFIVKHDRAMGFSLVENVLANRRDSPCYKEILYSALQKYPGQDLIPLTLKYINDPDKSVSECAAGLLFSQADSRAKLDSILRTYSSQIPNHKLASLKKSYYSHLDYIELESRQKVRPAVNPAKTFELSVSGLHEPHENTIKVRITIGEPFLKVMTNKDGSVNVAYGILMPPIDGEYPATFAVNLHVKDNHGSGLGGFDWKLTLDKTATDISCNRTCDVYQVTLSAINEDGSIKPIALFQQMKP